MRIPGWSEPGSLFRESLFRKSRMCCGLLLFLAVIPIVAAAQGHSWRVADFKDSISIAADGTALVSEKITVVFVGQWHGIHRTIPVEYPGPNGTNYTLFLKVQSVT